MGFIGCVLLVVVSTTASGQFCPSVHADFLHRQAAPPFSSDPYTEANGTKHTPYITINGATGTVKVGNGSPYHPMTASNDPTVVHFITHIYVLDQNDAFVAMSTLDPSGGGVAQMTFDIPITATQLVAYEWCNVHGLWRGPRVNVAAGPRAGACTKPAVATAAQPSWISDFHRRQKMVPFSSSHPFDESNGRKHTPYIRVSGFFATVTVGDGSPFHPMVASADPATVHYVTHIYVVDQKDKTIVMENLDPTNVTKASITFLVPSDATSLTAYEWCNKHGLWKGPTVNVTAVAGCSGMKLGVVAVLVVSLTLSLMA